MTVAYTQKPTVRVYGFPDASGNFSGCLSDMLLALSKQLNFSMAAKAYTGWSNRI